MEIYLSAQFMIFLSLVGDVRFISKSRALDVTNNHWPILPLKRLEKNLTKQIFGTDRPCLSYVTSTRCA